jgi:ATP-dependent Lon protease
MDHSAADEQGLSAGPEKQTEGETGAAEKIALPAIPSELPILPVRNVVVFPGTVVPLSIGREKKRRLIDAVLAGNKLLAVFAQRREDVEDPGINDIYRVGTVAQVLKLLRLPDGSNSLLVHGVQRAGLEEFVTTEPYWRAIIHPHEDATSESMELEALAHNARQEARQVIELSPNVPDEALEILESIKNPGPLADFLAANLSLGVVQKQELLETFDVADRLRKINATLHNQVEVLQLAKKLQTDVRKEIDKTQRRYYLQEQMKAIRKELGEEDSLSAEITELRERIDKAEMPEAVLKEADRELDRLGRISQASPEHGVIRDYLDWLIEMPWTRQTEDILDLNNAEAILNADHYGLEQIKKRILEYLAVHMLNPHGRSPILCFAGPPGVGKTSLGQSIARAIGRKFIRIALGGVRDEADIRGHRRTYIGAIPGRLMQEIRKAGTCNPLIMLDEMDKIGTDFRGDPAAALLEVLDPEQNHNFTDHYLGLPFDLSKVFFIGTANYMDPVEPALRDRMEEIELPGYTTDEKVEIAARYLVGRQIDRNGLKDMRVAFEKDTLRTIIENYTREAGVRELERTIGTICRSLAATTVKGGKIDGTVHPADLEQYIGPSRYEREIALRTSVPGVATGLAYTPVGGDILFIEATIMPGRGGFIITGQLGSVMQESAQAALSIIRSRGREWGIPVEKLADADIHIHVPAGAIPKDGPSAGVTLFTALFSLLTNTTVDPTVGMTGEITLRGLVLPIGGVKEKMLAAHRAGLKKIILPARNKRDLLEVPKEVREALQFVFAEQVEDVLYAAIPALEAARLKTAEKTKRDSKSKRVKPKARKGRLAAGISGAGSRRGGGARTNKKSAADGKAGNIRDWAGRSGATD